MVEAFRADVDGTLLEENLRLSVEDRFLKLIALQRFAKELRNAGGPVGEDRLRRPEEENPHRIARAPQGRPSIDMQVFSATTIGSATRSNGGRSTGI